MKQEIKYGIAALIGFIFGIMLCLLISKSSSGDSNIAPPKEVHDTILHTDTCIVEKLRYVTKFDTAVVVINKHTHDTDTVYVQLPIEHKEYRDTIGRDSARATIDILYSGYHAKIDTAIYTLDVIPPSPVKIKKGWGQGIGLGIGPAAGIFITPDGRAHFGGGVVVTATYNFGYHW